MRFTTGRQKSDYNYGNTLVYNNFVWPNVSDGERAAVEERAKAVLDARRNHPNRILAEMYDGISPVPDGARNNGGFIYDLWEYEDLRNAHNALDAVVEAAYGVNFDGDEEKIVQHLLKLYSEATSQ